MWKKIAQVHANRRFALRTMNRSLYLTWLVFMLNNRGFTIWNEANFSKSCDLNDWRVVLWWMHKSLVVSPQFFAGAFHCTFHRCLFCWQLDFRSITLQYSSVVSSNVLATVSCPLLNVSNSVLNTTDSNYSTAVQVVCNPGFAIDPLNLLNSSVNTVCTESGNWSTFPITCQRTLQL